ncbi:MAG: hypothetical protein WC482_01720 [Candidatus Omnitrophota bacterium]|jgi:hypothetical protein|nr:hypothetical protein [Candidatus Omnitrophota bacterium]
MKKIIVLSLLLSIATPSYAMNIVEKMLYKPVVLRNNSGVTVLVNRVTGRVVYVMSGGQYVVIPDVYKDQFQAVYDAQERQDLIPAGKQRGRL